MAEQLDSFDFGSTGRYPWDEWLDGSIYRLTRGTDFEAKPSSMVASARKAAQSRNMDVNTKVDGDSIVLQGVAKA